LSSIKINAYIFGDFNRNTMKSDESVSDFISMVKFYNYSFVNTSFPTRNQALIDHFLTNTPSALCNKFDDLICCTGLKEHHLTFEYACANDKFHSCS